MHIQQLVMHLFHGIANKRDIIIIMNLRPPPRGSTLELEFAAHSFWEHKRTGDVKGMEEARARFNVSASFLNVQHRQLNVFYHNVAYVQAWRAFVNLFAFANILLTDFLQITGLPLDELRELELHKYWRVFPFIIAAYPTADMTSLARKLWFDCQCQRCFEVRH